MKVAHVFGISDAEPSGSVTTTALLDIGTVDVSLLLSIIIDSEPLISESERCQEAKRCISNTRVYPKFSGLAAWSENCKCYSSLPLGAVVSLFCESV